MKIRNDFVTNSSSSSYVIAYKPIGDNDLLNKLIDTIIDVSSHWDTEEAEVFYTQEEYDSYFLEEYSWNGKNIKELIEGDEYLEEEYSGVKKYISEGYSIICKRVGNSDFTLNRIIRLLQDVLAEQESFIIISE